MSTDSKSITVESENTGLFIAIPRSIIEQPDIPHTVVHLFVYLRYCVNTSTRDEVVCPSYDDIRKKTGLSAATISKGLKWLEVHGWLKRKKRFNDSVVYTFTIPQPTVNQKMESSGYNIG